MHIDVTDKTLVISSGFVCTCMLIWQQFYSFCFQMYHKQGAFLILYTAGLFSPAVTRK